MPTDFPLPPAGASFEVRGSVLRITDAARGHICEVRVDEGIAFVRFPGQPGDGQWHDAAQRSVLAAFTSDSPIATFLRTQGLNPLRQLLTEIGAPTTDSAGSEA